MTDTPAERAAESTWTRLRRRKVVQWGLVYVAGAWGFLQGLEYVGESFNWPQQVRQIAVLVLVIELPIVLVLAWYHGDRGQQRISTPEFSILTLLLLLGGGAFWYYQRTSEAGKNAALTANAVQPHPIVRDQRCTPLRRRAAVREPEPRGRRRLLRRYAAGYPELLDTTDPRVSSGNLQLAIDVALVFQRMGDVDRAISATRCQ